MIPNKFQYIYLTNDSNKHPMYQHFHLVHYLCIKSAIEVNNPDEVIFNALAGLDGDVDDLFGGK